MINKEKSWEGIRLHFHPSKTKTGKSYGRNQKGKQFITKYLNGQQTLN